MLDLEENTKELLKLDSKIQSLGESLWHTKTKRRKRLYYVVFKGFLSNFGWKEKYNVKIKRIILSFSVYWKKIGKSISSQRIKKKNGI